MKIDPILIIGISSLILFSVVTQGKEPGRQYINVPRDAASKKPPFSDAVLVGDTLYLSGHIGLLSDNTVPTDSEAEAKLVLQRFEATLKAAGFTLDDVVYVQVFCSDVKDFDHWNTVYRTVFKEGKYPARAFIGSGKLLFQARFEIQGIAVKSR